MLNQSLSLLTSLRLTVACLAYSLLLVFIGTIAQVDEGLYEAQKHYFKSWFAFWPVPQTSLKLPMFGGYFVGTLLLVNLISAHVKRFTFTWKKGGIFLIHIGVIVLLLGQLLTDVFSEESVMRIEKGETKSFSENQMESEVVFASKLDSANDLVVAIPESLLKPDSVIANTNLPFQVKIVSFWKNAKLEREAGKGTIKPDVNMGAGTEVFVLPQKTATSMDDVNMPAAIVEILDGKTSLGRWLLWSGTAMQQKIEHGGKDFQVSLRFERDYKPYSFTLIDCKHEKYKGTDVPKNFSSQIRLVNTSTGEDTERLIYMNNPLRYDGLTFYQFQMNSDEMGGTTSTVLQVVRNPSWLAPYFGCCLVGFGLLYQFLSHLIGFLGRRVQ
ncbi:MAG: ResB protein required for cytochrome C biosynthesis [Pedosphaera sp.]|nr:ResB protein required for cytochrome C biosynthesis [Pedosphaera sp.]